MSRSKVWLRPIGQATKVQAEAKEISDSLRILLQHRGFACTPCMTAPGTERFSFRAGYVAEADRPAVGELLARLPDVMLMNAPE